MFLILQAARHCYDFAYALKQWKLKKAEQQLEQGQMPAKREKTSVPFSAGEAAGKKAMLSVERPDSDAAITSAGQITVSKLSVKAAPATVASTAGSSEKRSGTVDWVRILLCR